MALKLGKTPARPGAVKLRMSKYLDYKLLPPPPEEFGHDALISDWGMLANDSLGDCVIAGGLHEVMLWNAEAGKRVNVNDSIAIRNYSDITGYTPGNPDTDQGTDMEEAAKYRRTTGLLDADGLRHKIGAYVALDPGNLNELWYAIYLFGGVGIGVEFPSQWMDAFNRGKPWDKVSHPKMEGGHYVTAVGKHGGNASVITWGAEIPLTPAGYQQFNDETVVYLTEESLINGVSLEGFNLGQLQADLAQLVGAPVPTPTPAPAPTPTPAPVPTPGPNPNPPSDFPVAAVGPWLAHKHNYTHNEKLAADAIQAWCSANGITFP